mmetsp:Transcript_69611/g.157360  ORF Transcript_69611/g.157360 Transcript_69611/m.157360 type:complete len:390 (+) Transcript_69611:33-1202(+)
MPLRSHTTPRCTAGAALTLAAASGALGGGVAVASRASHTGSTSSRSSEASTGASTGTRVKVVWGPRSDAGTPTSLPPTPARQYLRVAFRSRTLATGLPEAVFSVVLSSGSRWKDAQGPPLPARSTAPPRPIRRQPPSFQGLGPFLGQVGAPWVRAPGARSTSVPLNFLTPLKGPNSFTAAAHSSRSTLGTGTPDTLNTASKAASGAELASCRSPDVSSGPSLSRWKTPSKVLPPDANLMSKVSVKPTLPAAHSVVWCGTCTENLSRGECPGTGNTWTAEAAILTPLYSIPAGLMVRKCSPFHLVRTRKLPKMPRSPANSAPPPPPPMSTCDSAAGAAWANPWVRSARRMVWRNWAPCLGRSAAGQRVCWPRLSTVIMAAGAWSGVLILR